MEKTGLAEKYGELIFPEKSTEKVLAILQEKYPMSQITISDMDAVMQSVFSIIAHDAAQAAEVEIFTLSHCDRTKVFFAGVQRDYGEGVGVYIFKAEDKLYSNCSALECLMEILQGAGKDDVCSQNSRYYNYLLHFQTFEKITHLDWKEYSAIFDDGK